MVSATLYYFVTGAFNTSGEASDTFGCLVSGTYLVVIEQVFASDVYRGEVRHYDICSGIDTFFAAQWIHSAEGCSGGQKYIRQYETDQG